MLSFNESVTDMDQYDQKVFSSFQTTFGASSNKISELHKELEILANFYAPPSTGIVVSDAINSSVSQNINFIESSLPDIHHINIDIDNKNESGSNLNFSSLNLNSNSVMNNIGISNSIQENTGLTILVSLFLII